MCNTATGATVAEVPELSRTRTGVTVAELPELWNAATGANLERMYRDRTLSQRPKESPFVVFAALQQPFRNPDARDFLVLSRSP